MTRSKMTPVDQARYALAYGTRADLSPEAQAEYDRLKDEGVPVTGSPDPLDERTARTSPEVRARILALFKTSRKYRLPFEKDRLAAASFFGTESWADYGAAVLQMAILDTLLSIEEKLTERDDAHEGWHWDLRIGARAPSLSRTSRPAPCLVRSQPPRYLPEGLGATSHLRSHRPDGDEFDAHVGALAHR